MTIRRRYVLRLVLLTVLACLLIATSVTVMSRVRQLELVTDDARDSARLVAHMADDTADTVVDQLIRQDGEVLAVGVFDGTGKPLLVQSAPDVAAPTKQTLDELLARATPEDPQPIDVDGTTLTTVASVSRPSPRYVVVSTSIAYAVEVIWANLLLNVVLTILIAGVAALVAWRTARRLAEPISRLDRAADDLENGRYDAARLEPVLARSDELGRMARRFDHMALEVQAREAALRDQLAALQVRIDDQARRERVDEIVGSEGFADLEARARRMRARRTAIDGGAERDEP